MGRPVKRGRGRGRPSKNSVSQNLPEFFKIYLPEHNSKQLVIPPDFIKNFKGKTPKKVILKNLQGKVWNVELEQANTKLLIKQGWESFVIDNSLERGEFLIFTYNVKTAFTVKIFSINGCVKEETTTIDDQPHLKVKEEPDLDQESIPHTDVCEKRSLERGVKVERVSQDSCEVMAWGSPERIYQWKNIRFTKVLDGRPYEMHIPTGVFTEHNIKPPKRRSSEMILLRNQRGVSQQVKIWHRYDRVVLSCGWREFQLKNKVGKGDECEFEVILDQGRKIVEILLLEIHPRRTKLEKATEL